MVMARFNAAWLDYYYHPSNIPGMGIQKLLRWYGVMSSLLYALGKSVSYSETSFANASAPQEPWDERLKVFVSLEV